MKARMVELEKELEKAKDGRVTGSKHEVLDVVIRRHLSLHKTQLALPVLPTPTRVGSSPLQLSVS